MAQKVNGCITYRLSHGDEIYADGLPDLLVGKQCFSFAGFDSITGDAPFFTIEF